MRKNILTPLPTANVVHGSPRPRAMRGERGTRERSPTIPSCRMGAWRNGAAVVIARHAGRRRRMMRWSRRRMVWWCGADGNMAQWSPIVTSGSNRWCARRVWCMDPPWSRRRWMVRLEVPSHQIQSHQCFCIEADKIESRWMVRL